MDSDTAAASTVIKDHTQVDRKLWKILIERHADTQSKSVHQASKEMSEALQISKMNSEDSLALWFTMHPQKQLNSGSSKTPKLSLKNGVHDDECQLLWDNTYTIVANLCSEQYLAASLLEGEEPEKLELLTCESIVPDDIRELYNMRFITQWLSSYYDSKSKNYGDGLTRFKLRSSMSLVKMDKSELRGMQIYLREALDTGDLLEKMKRPKGEATQNSLYSRSFDADAAKLCLSVVSDHHAETCTSCQDEPPEVHVQKVLAAAGLGEETRKKKKKGKKKRTEESTVVLSSAKTDAESSASNLATGSGGEAEDRSAAAAESNYSVSSLVDRLAQFQADLESFQKTRGQTE